MFVVFPGGFSNTYISKAFQRHAGVVFLDSVSLMVYSTVFQSQTTKPKKNRKRCQDAAKEAKALAKEERKDIVKSSETTFKA
jgi:adenosyl cobinamide kinase/adenosyl cobinamide phosphate guanylyltransferase